MAPAVVVLGIGAVALPVPPDGKAYHNNEVPVAVRAVAVVFWQKLTGVVTVGATGVALTITARAALGLSQPVML